MKKRRIFILSASILIVVLGISYAILSSLPRTTGEVVTTKEITESQAVEEMPGIIITVKETLFMLDYKSDPDMQAQINKGEAVVPTAGIIERVKGILPEGAQMDDVNFSGDDNTYYLNYRASDCRVFLQIYLPEDIINKTVVVYKRDGDVKVAYGNNNNAKYSITKGKTYFKLG